MIFVASFSALIDTDGTSQAFLFATEAFATGASGTPANTIAYRRLFQPGNLVRSIASGRRIFGLTEAGFGEVVIENTDGAFDALATYGVAGNTIEVYGMDDGASPWDNFPAGFSRIFAATMQTIIGDGSLLRIRVREKLDLLDKPICPLFDDTDLVDATLVGTAKPVVYGGCYNVSPVLVDAQNLLYMVSARGEVSGHHAKDSGSVIARMLTAGAQELNAADDWDELVDLAVPPGHYGTCTDEGLMKLGSVPVGQLTCDALEYKYGDPRIKAGDVLQDIAEDAVPGIEKDALAWAAFGTWWSTGNTQSAVGFFARDTSTTYAQALSAIAASIGAWVGFDKDGVFTGAIVEDPAGMTSARTITEHHITSIRRVVDEEAKGVPYGRIINRFPKNWTVQTSGLAGVVPANVRAELEQEYPLSYEVVCEVPSDNTTGDVPVTTQFPGAPDYVINGYAHGRRVTSTGDLEAYVACDTLQFEALLGVRRDWFEISMPFTIDLYDDIDLGVCVTVQHRRFGLSAGKQLMIVGIRYELSGAPAATLTLWG